MIGYHQFIRETQPKLRAEGKHVGIGIVAYVEGTGIGPYEGREGAGDEQWTRLGRHRCRHTGTGALHKFCPDRGRAAWRGRGQYRCRHRATPTSSIGARGRSPAAARWLRAMPSMKRRKWCAGKSSSSPPSISKRRR